MIDTIAATLDRLCKIAAFNGRQIGIQGPVKELKRNSEIAYNQAEILSREYGLNFGFNEPIEGPSSTSNKDFDTEIFVGELSSACYALRGISHELEGIAAKIPAYAAIQGRIRARAFVHEFYTLLELADEVSKKANGAYRSQLIDHIVNKQVRKTSYRLTKVAAGILPIGSRIDYEERFRSELFDLAESGSGWWKQVRHSLRVLIRAPWLRYEIRAMTLSPRRSSDD
ncbi:hypothetical protein [Amycolatopsis coloradensis]|uniref:hypothetical protein n=1 Tax=Amycolatopsis coloradensis TaxID=76021 RepID=UPI001178C214|nr:hypothetical protein [Amycolatopsis coloradensis]